MDVVDELDLQLEDTARHVQELFAQAKITVAPETTFEQVSSVVDSHEELSSMEDGKLRSVFDFVSFPTASSLFFDQFLTRSSVLNPFLLQLHTKVVAKHAEEVRKAERKRRHQIDDFRFVSSFLSIHLQLPCLHFLLSFSYALKKVDPPIDLDSTYEEVSRPRVSLTLLSSRLNHTLISASRIVSRPFRASRGCESIPKWWMRTVGPPLASSSSVKRFVDRASHPSFLSHADLSSICAPASTGKAP